MGLFYNLFRYYDPESGRFTQPDPIDTVLKFIWQTVFFVKRYS
ncbi:RHS repeat-associated core domain-containing protein [Salmonella enterica]